MKRLALLSPNWDEWGYPSRAANNSSAGSKTNLLADYEALSRFNFSHFFDEANYVVACQLGFTDRDRI